MSFVKRNLVAIVMIPSVILVHYGWTKLQYIDDLVPASERKTENPAIAAPTKVLAYLMGKHNNPNPANEISKGE
uniref:CSON009053 protein n=1 Tax=Culicoides sonorensis TaxID=179676 RepID=A0A336M3D6_CULSO